MIPAPGPGAAGNHGAARPVDGGVVRDTVAADRAAGRRSSCSCCASARSIGVSTPLEGQGTVREQKGDLHRAQHTGWPQCHFAIGGVSVHARRRSLAVILI